MYPSVYKSGSADSTHECFFSGSDGACNFPAGFCGATRCKGHGWACCRYWPHGCGIQHTFCTPFAHPLHTLRTPFAHPLRTSKCSTQRLQPLTRLWRPVRRLVAGRAAAAGDVSCRSRPFMCNFATASIANVRQQIHEACALRRLVAGSAAAAGHVATAAGGQLGRSRQTSV